LISDKNIYLLGNEKEIKNR